MKKITGILGLFKLVLKYASWVIVIVDIVNYAIEQVEKHEGIVADDYKKKVVTEYTEFDLSSPAMVDEPKENV